MKTKCINLLLKSSIRRSYSSSNATETKLSPLAGIKILDMTRILAGPFATMVMSDLGAEVIKVESPRGGDDTRSWGPPFISAQDGSTNRESCYFLSVNRNKKSICVNMKKQEGKKILQQLACNSDVLIENYVPGKLDSMGLGYKELSGLNSRLIYCSITGFGPDGPHSKRGGYDVIAASMGGLLHVTGEEGGAPSKVGVAMTDLMTALYAHGAILAAILQRQQTGIGQKIDCNLLSTQVSAMTHLASNWLNAGIVSKRWGTAHASIVPYQAFTTKDGYFTIGCGNDKQFVELCHKIGAADLTQDSRFSSNENRVAHRSELLPQLSRILEQKTNSEWSQIFEGVSFPYGPVNDMRGVFNDEQVQHNELDRSVQHPTIGPMRVVGPAVKYSQSYNDVRGPPPTLGQHTDSVLQELGYSNEEIKHLRREEVIS